MKSYNLRYVYRNVGRLLKELPFAITKNGKVVAWVLGYEPDSGVLKSEKYKNVRVKPLLDKMGVT